MCKFPNSSNLYSMKLEWLKLDLCAPKAWKKLRIRRVRRQKSDFGEERYGL